MKKNSGQTTSGASVKSGLSEQSKFKAEPGGDMAHSGNDKTGKPHGPAKGGAARGTRFG